MSRTEGLAVVREHATAAGIAPEWVLSPRRFKTLVSIRRRIALKLRELGWHPRDIGFLFGLHRTTVIQLTAPEPIRNERKAAQMARYYAKAKPPRGVAA